MKIRKIVLLVIVICASVGFSLLPPLVLERIVNMLTNKENVSITMAFLYFLLLVAAGLADSGKEIMITITGERITRNIRHKMCQKLTRLSADYFTMNETGKITSRFVNDVDAVETLFDNGIISMIADACKVISIVVVIFIKSYGLGIIMLIITPGIFFLTRVFQKRMLRAQLTNRKAIAKVNNHVPETIMNIRMIHSLCREKYMEKRYDKYIENSYRAVEKTNLYDSIYSPIIIFISCIVVSVMMIGASMGGGIREFFGMSVGTAVAVTAYVGKVFGPIEGIGMEIQNIQAAVAGLQRIKEFMKEEEKPEADSNYSLADFNMEAGIRFDNVDFSYSNGTKVFNNFSTTITQGEVVTFTGRTGAGKSTAFRLLLGLYSPDKGRVTIFSEDADRIPDRMKRQVFGYVEQSFTFINGTVAEQISLCDPDITRDMIEKAARLSMLHDVIINLPNGYDTVIDDKMFSQGQLQLLAIARAVVADPKVLLLDEITANLDTDIEQRVMQAIMQASEDRTVISISHRLSEHIERVRIIRIVF